MSKMVKDTFKSDQSIVHALILSDSHGDVEGIINIISHHLDIIDLVIFLGDGAEDLVEASYIFPELLFYAVAGNNDFPLPSNARIQFPLERLIDIFKIKIYLTHGHIVPYRRVKEAIVDQAESFGANIAFYGHLHVTELQKSGEVCLVNPGSIRYPRGGSVASYAVVEFFESQYKILFYNAKTHENILDIHK